MKKSKGIISLILTVVLIALLGFTTVVGFGKGQTGAAKNIKLGLDLEGGVSITYQVKGDTPSKEDMSDTIYKLQKRVEQYSTEATVYQEGDNRISIEIPGVTDANEILSELGQPGSLYFIKEKDSDGNPNYGLDTSGHYVLAKSMDELKEEGSVVLTGTDIKSAKSGSYQDSTTGANENVVQLSMTKEGTEKFAEATKAAKEAAKEAEETIAIYYDGELISVPRVNAEITDGQAIIEGSMEYEEAEQLASTIRIGGLSVELEEIRSNVVGAQLGEEAISTSLMAGAIGLAIVFVFMCMVYLLPGLASSLALVIYTGLILVLLNAFDITLTLPGIAGIILGIGMAVDANVIIFARVKEELTAGKSVKSALNAGFHKAMSAILDGNITTLIAAAVLWLKGSGTVKGFAQTLALGIVVSMFTALVITRMIVYAFYAVGIRNPKLYGRIKEERAPIDFLGKRKIFFAVSVAVILIGFVFMGVNAGAGKGALNYSLEFKGGTSTNVTFDKAYTLKEIDETMIPDLEKVTDDPNIQVQTVANSNQVIFKTQTLDLEKREAFAKYMADEFGVEEKDITTENISSTVSSEMRVDAIIAVAIATVFMLLYIWLRFKDIRFATSAVVALIHDVLVVLAFYVIARISVGNTFIACMLTIVGYSINATIVIFDRIREEMKTKKRTEELDTLVNRCITRTLTRSIYTSLTTFVMVAVLFVMGVSSIKEFALPLMVGIICGAYSSVCITGALWYVMKTKIVKKAESAKAGTSKKKK
ncbi:protein translocase subunit SecD [Mediterraneibacter gnavus]|uniref:Multifunctional fusion protein n=1 Tax=Mediterraneibacter gnavus TaxID=33038 RepID=A0AAJ1F451_MEDGN|nr:protein translocase subunit SecD [Mediterraneibacter gnavus]MCB5618545.1 protein translocase subunit SecD [Mediterraneibacter gnavus]MCB5663836.1 protein translocase subunit SecD [Mediterraneibacter gnavus]MCB5680780.1 protein translocase subunit SecD [Mediterraneibacter gnavus]NSH67757.1 protein translocase subunit SecD [Mediterraneibacter gnavus]NSH78142.1 protein translocase subunit SecD [Mediterraneibacter gnavus]